MLAPTSITVFVGYTHPFKTQVFNKPVELFSFTDYERYFGGFFRNEFFDAEAALFGDVALTHNGRNFGDRAFDFHIRWCSLWL